MGRHSYSINTNQTLRIELTRIINKGYLSKGKTSYGQINWINGDCIAIEVTYTKTEQFVRLSYVHTDKQGNKSDYDYKIQLTFVPSNLGKGKVPYFLCPVSGKRCRILYRAYGSLIWKSREAYKNRIYYALQTSSKLSIMNDKYWLLDRKLKAIYKDIRYQTHYKGKPTRRYKRFLKMLNERERAEFLRWTPQYMPKVVRKHFQGKEWI